MACLQCGHSRRVFTWRMIDVSPRGRKRRRRWEHPEEQAETPEEKCARRTAKRVAGVSALQRTTAYIVVISRGDVPPAPDPYDMTLSKRQLGGATPGIANKHNMKNPPLSASP